MHNDIKSKRLNIYIIDQGIYYLICSSIRFLFIFWTTMLVVFLFISWTHWFILYLHTQLSHIQRLILQLSDFSGKSVIFTKQLFRNGMYTFLFFFLSDDMVFDYFIRLSCLLLFILWTMFRTCNDLTLTVNLTYLLYDEIWMVDPLSIVYHALLFGNCIYYFICSCPSYLELFIFWIMYHTCTNLTI